MFDSLRKSGAKSGEIVAEIRGAQSAIGEAEKKLSAAEAEAHEAVIGGGDAEKHSRNLAALRLRLDALRAGSDRLRGALRDALEREHADARTRAEKELAECAKADADLAGEIAPAAVKLLRLAMQRRGRKIGPVIAMQIFDALSGAGLPPGVTGWQFMEAAARGYDVLSGTGVPGDATAKALMEAVKSELPDNAARGAAARAILDSHLDVDAEVARLLNAE